MKTSTSRGINLIRAEDERRKVLLNTNVVLFLALLMIIFILPAISPSGHFLSSILLGTIVISGLFAADFSKAAFRILFSIGSLVLVVTALNVVFPETRGLKILTFLLNTLFFILVTFALVSHVARARKVYGSTLLCAINSYLLIGLTLSILALTLDLIDPGSFAQINPFEEGFSTFVYYGFVTLSTLGYGDITPNTEVARSLSIFTALFGQLYLVMIMALIIGKYLRDEQTPE